MRTVLVLVVMCAVAHAYRPSPHVRPVEGHIIDAIRRADGTTELTVMYTHYRWKLDTKHWRARFVVDGNLVDCVELTIASVDYRAVRVTYRPAHPDAPLAAKLVRFEPNERGYDIERDPASNEEAPALPSPTAKSDACDAPWTVGYEEAHARPIDAPLQGATVAGGALQVFVQLPDNGGLVTRHWKGVFTVDGVPLTTGPFSFDEIAHGLAMAHLPLPAAYTDHVRLLPPE